MDDINFEDRLETRNTKDGSIQYEWVPISSELYEQLMWLWGYRVFKRSPSYSTTPGRKRH